MLLTDMGDEHYLVQALSEKGEKLQETLAPHLGDAGDGDESKVEELAKEAEGKIIRSINPSIQYGWMIAFGGLPLPVGGGDSADDGGEVPSVQGKFGFGFVFDGVSDQILLFACFFRNLFL